MTRTPSSGNRLTRNRRALKLTRQDVAQRLGLTPTDVKYLDNWQLDKLPASVDVREAIRLYARLLNLNPTDLTRGVSDVVSTNPSKKSLISLSHTGGSLVTLLLLASIGGFLFWRTFNAVSVPELNLTEPRQGMRTDQPLVMIKGRSSERAQVFVNGTTVPLEPDGSFSSEVVLSPGANTIKVVALNTFGRQAEVTRSVIYQSGENTKVLDEQR